MDKYRQIAEIIRGFRQSGQTFFPATVESVEGVTCTVKVDGLSISDVRLKATTETTENRVLLTPVIGSNVLVGSLSGDFSNLFVLSADEIDSVEISCNGLKIEVSSDGLLSVKNDGYGLQKAFEDLITAIKLLTVPTATGPSGTPINTAQFDLIKTNMSNFLK